MTDKFFNKSYKHAYKRGNSVWVKGSLSGALFHRMSTGKEFNQTNMNWVEKHWEEILKVHFEKQDALQQRSSIPSLNDLVAPTMKYLEESADPRTIKRYGSFLKNYVLPQFGNHKPDEVTKAMIRTFQTKLRTKFKLSRKTILNIRASFSALYRYANDADIVSENPVLQVRAPEPKLFITVNEADGKEYNQKGKEVIEHVDPFTLDDVWKLLNHLRAGQFKNMLTLLFFTGMRTGEMVALRWDDVDWNGMSIHIMRTNKKEDGTVGLPKHGKKRKIDLLPPVAKALKAQFQLTGLKDGYIFLNKDGDRYRNYDTLGEWWKSLLKQTGFDQRSLYQTRHTFASIMLQKGEELLWVSRVMLGHSDVSTTLKCYARYIKDDSKRHASFLYDERTNSVQGQSLKRESA